MDDKVDVINHICKTCKWFDPPEHGYYLGDCNVPFDETAIPWSYSRSNVEACDGKDCPAWQEAHP